MSEIKEGLLTPTDAVAPDLSYARLAVDSIPAMLGISMEVIIMTVNLHYAQGSVMTAGLGLSMVLIHSLGGSLILGFNSGYSNFASRSFGANNHRLFNKYLIKGLVSLALLLILFTILGFGSEWLALVCGQDPLVARYARQFYVYQLPGFFCMFTADLLRVYLNAQSIFEPINYVNGLTIALHFFLSFFISRNYGMTGIIISTNLTFLSQLGMTFYVERRHSTWKLTTEEFQEKSWQESYEAYVKECFYMAFPLVMDLFMFELIALFVGSFKIIEQTAAHVAFSNIAMLFAGTMLGFSCTSMVKGSQLVGQNDSKRFREIAWRTLLLNLAAIYFLYLVVWLSQDTFFSYYTDDPKVMYHLKSCLVPYFVMNVFDAFQFVSSQMYKALQMGSWVCQVFFLSYYVCGGGAMLILNMYLDSKILCAWWAFTVGLFASACFYVYRYYGLDL